MNYSFLKSNELLSHITGSTQAAALMERYGNLARVNSAMFDMAYSPSHIFYM
jgi:hypothetical protein